MGAWTASQGISYKRTGCLLCKRDGTRALQLALSPDGKYAFALVYGTSGAFFTQANVVVVDIRTAKKVRNAATDWEKRPRLHPLVESQL